jgi:hypothetical protein
MTREVLILGKFNKNRSNWTSKMKIQAPSRHLTRKKYDQQPFVQLFLSNITIPCSLGVVLCTLRLEGRRQVASFSSCGSVMTFPHTGV